MSKPEVIGELHSVKVLIDREARSVIIATEVPIKFSIDDPNIQGTNLERYARAWLDTSEAIRAARAKQTVTRDSAGENGCGNG